jgi:hypothetical protein
LGSQLDVSRTPEAMDCPDSAQLARAVSALGTAPNRPAEPLRVEVAFERSQDGYGATLRSFGAKPGLRRLATPGKTCGPLADAVGVALAVLFDLIPQVEKKPNESTELPPSPREEERRAPFVLALGVRAGLGYGEVGSALSGVFSATLRLSRERFQLLGSGFWHTHRDTEFAQGSVRLGLWGGGLDACYRFGPSLRTNWSPCAGVRLGSLSGSGVEFDRNYDATQTWGALAAGGKLQVPLAKAWAFIANLSVIVPLRQHTFSVDTVGSVETRPLGLVLEIGPEAAIW